MELIEMMVVMGKDRMIQLPEEEVRVMGLEEGDELCLSYLVDDRMEGKVNGAGEQDRQKRSEKATREQVIQEEFGQDRYSTHMVQRTCPRHPPL